jgi:hypothetical protein
MQASVVSSKRPSLLVATLHLSRWGPLNVIHHLSHTDKIQISMFTSSLAATCHFHIEKQHQLLQISDIHYHVFGESLPCMAWLLRHFG